MVTMDLLLLILLSLTIVQREASASTDLTNIAGGKTTRTSSTTAISEEAVDGDVNTCFLIDDVEHSKWWRIDLGTNPVYRIIEVKLMNTKPTGCYKRPGIQGGATFNLTSANTEQQCCDECKSTPLCIYWVCKPICLMYLSMSIEAVEKRSLGYNENKPSLMTYNATVHAGNSVEFGKNAVCGEQISVDDTSKDELQFACNPTFARYISIEQEHEVDPLRFCEVEVYSDLEFLCEDISITTETGVNFTSIAPLVIKTTNTVDEENLINAKCIPKLNSKFYLGNSNVTCVFIDTAGYNAKCDFEVTVVDKEAPNVTCGDITSTSLPGGTVIVETYGNITTRDNVDVNEDIKKMCTPEEQSSFTNGTTNIRCTFLDTAGNQANCTFVITVKEIPLKGVCPTTIETSLLPPDNEPVSVNWTAPDVSIFDDISMNSTYHPLDTFSNGSTTVVYTFKDKHNNTYNCSFEVSVNYPCLIYEPSATDYEEPLLYILHGDSAVITCEDGFRPTANVTLICNDGSFNYEIPDCIDIDECKEEAHPCDFENKNEVCENTDGWYECKCTSSFRRDDNRGCIPDVLPSQCIAIGSSICGETLDSVNNVIWPSTKANCSEVAKCGQGYYGKVIRYCGISGDWSAPDTTYCLKGTIKDIANQARTVNTSKEAEKIVDAIEKVISLDKRTIHGGDLLKVIEILDTILHTDPLMLQGDVGSKKNFSFVFVKIVSNMLDKRNEQRWQYIHRNKGVDKGTAAVFEDLGKFDLVASYFIREYNLTIHLAYENIEYQAYLLSHGKKYMETLRVGHEHDSRVARSVNQTSVSDAILPSFDLSNDTETTVAIVYVYHNFGELLPVGDAQVDESRQWVKSITALKRERKVNSPVVSLTLYTDSGSIQELESLKFTTTMYHKEVGYDAECVHMVYGNPKSIWNSQTCSKVSSKSSTSFTTCECNAIGNYAILMTIGEKPVPFPIAARWTIVIIVNVLSVLLFLLSFMFVTFARVSTDRYNLLKVSILSYILMPILTIASLCVDEKSRACQTASIAVQVAQVVNVAWTLNLSIEVFLRLSLYIHTSNAARLLNVCTGWILPGILLCWFAINPSTAIDDAKSCWSQVENSVIYAVTAINVTMVLISIFCLGYTHILYNNEKKKYEPDEWQKFWEELRSVMQFLLADAAYWIAGSYATITDDLVAGYVFALASFVFASVVFLSACATNSEMIRAIRIQYEGDEDYKAGLVEVKKTENARFDARRRIRCQVQQHMTKIKQLKKAKQQKEKAKSDAITGIFILAKKQEKKNKVIPIEFEEDFSI